MNSLPFALPEGYSEADFRSLVSPEMWERDPQQAAIHALRRSGKFDISDYLERYPDVEKEGIDPVQHFVEYGISENRYFKYLPDIKFGESKVRLAHQYFKMKDYEKALILYEELASKIGEKNFAANIAICKKRMGNKKSIKNLYQDIYNKKPKVSIIVPVYNNAQYLHECIDSIINQTLREIEIIIINDGSTDKEAVKILDNYAKSDNRIKLIHKKNTGYGHSMNVGINNATGEYIGIVESDDYILNETYSFLYKTICKTGCDIVKSTLTEFSDSSGGRKFRIVHSLENDNDYYKCIDPKSNYKIFRAIITNQTCIFNRNFIDKYSIRFNETPGSAFQDNGFHFQTFCLAQKIYFIKESFYMHREDNPLSSVNSKEKIFCTADEYEFIREFIEKNRDVFIYFKCHYTLRKFLSFSFTLKRISNDYKDMYKKFFSQEMENAIKNNELDPKMLKKHELDQLVSILGHDNIYYIRRINKVNKVKLSVIVPIYNNEKYLSECIESIINQSLKEIEIICINDGSSDMSSEILDYYATQYDRIYILDKKNSGAGSARNLGIDHSTGEYIVFMDGDDFYPNMNSLKNLYNSAKINNLNVVGGNMVEYQLGLIKQTSLKRKNETKLYSELQYDYGYTTYIYKRNLLYRYNIRFPNYIRYQDPPFLVRALFASNIITYIDYDVYAYRFEKKNNMNEEQVYGVMLGLIDVLQFSKQNSLEKLHVQTIRRLSNDYFERIKNKINNKIKEKVNIFYSLIDLDLVRKAGCTQGNINYFNARIKNLI